MKAESCWIVLVVLDELLFSIFGKSIKNFQAKHNRLQHNNFKISILATKLNGDL